MKIVKLTAENVKRIRAVEITPQGNTVVIAGRNGQGKTSVLDSIWFALGGGPAARETSKPIRDGETSAHVTLDLGELRVTRSWSGDKTTLKVESAEGATYRSPQAMLDSLVGRLSFDPLAFAQQDERTQLKSLLELVELPFDPVQLDGQRATLYDLRTAIGRTGKQLQGQLAGMPRPAADLPAAEVSVSALVEQYRAAREQVDEHTNAERAATALAAEVERYTDQVAERRRQLELALNGLAEAQTAQVEAAAHAGRLRAALPDVGPLEQQLADADVTNAAVRAAQQRADVAVQMSNAQAEYETLTRQIGALDKRKADAIAAAAMPIDGLAFDTDGVTYRGMPFKQCSAAEQLRVSLAMAMAMNPQIRVVRITDGSLLDSDNMRLIEEMAVEHDYQVWIERVDESGAVGVVIEDGQVAS